MRLIIQRVSHAAVRVEQTTVGEIGQGLLVLAGVTTSDTPKTAALLAEKTAHLRVFADAEGKFNYSLLDVAGAALVVSQFTLYADVRKGRRPNFMAAAAPELAVPVLEAYVQGLRELGIAVQTGQFGAMMQVTLVNEGPVTIILDSTNWEQPRPIAAWR